MRGSGIPRLLIAASLVAVIGCTGPAASASPVATDAAIAPTAPPSPADTVVSTATDTPGPTTTAAATPAPSTAPPDVFQPVGLAYATQFVMRIAVTDLNVRAKPSTKASSLGKANKGALYLVSDWPIKADGNTWYYGYELLTPKVGVLPNLPQPLIDGYDGVLSGWMAAGTTENPFLVPLAARCPATPDIPNIAAMLPYERIVCFGSDTITFQGTYGCEYCDGETAGKFEPTWLAGQLEFDFLRDTTGDSRVTLHFPPGGQTQPAYGATVRVFGHYADPRSSTCSIVLNDASDNPTQEVPDGIAKQWCEGRFVVEQYEVIS